MALPFPEMSFGYPVYILEGVGHFGADHIDGQICVVEEGCLQKNSSCAYNASSCEHPEEQAIQDHGDILPLVFYLSIGGENEILLESGEDVSI
ncbi:hypothetical protein CDAR_421261 [Caerostris darwini]|uniref:Uncharacterized protein n=1 Tax=Caerostris darwini TaxID=1538125 RepID=A0AAV4TMI2_9ARAC|nr:hypothetical protein CDAR_421261 [Caerostris darwini]